MSFLFRKLIPITKNVSLINQLTGKFHEISLTTSAIPLQQKLSNIDITTEVTNKILTKNTPGSTLNNVNNLIKNRSEGRLFAIVQLCGKQFKITTGDVILVEGYWPPTIGDKISLNKVLLAGSNDFTLIGKPILEPGLCEVQATIIEKTLTHTKTNFRKKRRKQFMRINFYRSPNTMIRINSIEFNSNIDIENVKNREKGRLQMF